MKRLLTLGDPHIDQGTLDFLLHRGSWEKNSGDFLDSSSSFTTHIERLPRFYWFDSWLFRLAPSFPYLYYRWIADLNCFSPELFQQHSLFPSDSLQGCLSGLPKLSSHLFKILNGPLPLGLQWSALQRHFEATHDPGPEMAYGKFSVQVPKTKKVQWILTFLQWLPCGLERRRVCLDTRIVAKYLVVGHMKCASNPSISTQETKWDEQEETAESTLLSVAGSHVWCVELSKNPKGVSTPWVEKCYLNST